jgi:hypothetical protein
MRCEPTDLLSAKSQKIFQCHKQHNRLFVCYPKWARGYFNVIARDIYTMNLPFKRGMHILYIDKIASYRHCNSAYNPNITVCACVCVCVCVISQQNPLFALTFRMVIEIHDSFPSCHNGSCSCL